MKEIDNQHLTLLSPYDLDAWTNEILYLIENDDILESKANQIKMVSKRQHGNRHQKKFLII